MSDLPDVGVVVQQMRGVPPGQRTALLQRCIGARTESPLLLDRRARLVTALREARVWPDGCPGSDAPMG